MTGRPMARHDVLFYDTDAELVENAVRFLRTGLGAGEAAIVVCAEQTTELLMEPLDNEGRIVVLPQPVVYQRPPGAIATYTKTVLRQVAAGARRVRLVGEVDFDGQPDGWTEWIKYESVMNRAFADLPVWAVCAYNVRKLPPQVLAGAELTHPTLLSGDARAANPRYVDPAEYLRYCAIDAYDPLQAGTPTFEADTVNEIALLRRGLRDALAACGHTGRSAEALVIAANEVVANATRHGAPPVRVRLWSSPERSVCAVTDHGPGFDDPFAGYLYTAATAQGGRGLWLTRQLCDTVHIGRDRTDDLFTVCLHIRHEPSRLARR